MPNHTRLKAEYLSRQNINRSLATWNCGVADTTIREPPPPGAWGKACPASDDINPSHATPGSLGESLCRAGAVPVVKVRSVLSP